MFNTFHDAVAETGANTAMIFVPPRFAADSILEAEDAGIALIVAITEGIPAHDELRVYNHLARNDDVRLVGPNCPGILSPGKANVGIIPAALLQRGQRRRRLALGHADLPDRQRAGPARLRQLEHRRHRRRPGSGLELHRHHRPLRGRRETELIVMAGEIGGSAEEEAADFIADNVSKPVVAYIAGFTAPPGKTMGHAGAIVSGTAGTATAKQEALEARGRARRPHADRGRRDRRGDRRLAGAVTFTSPLAETLAPDLLDRFLRYVRVDTQSARDRDAEPEHARASSTSAGCSSTSCARSGSTTPRSTTTAT